MSWFKFFSIELNFHWWTQNCLHNLWSSFIKISRKPHLSVCQICDCKILQNFARFVIARGWFCRSVSDQEIRTVKFEKIEKAMLLISGCSLVTQYTTDKFSIFYAICWQWCPSFCTSYLHFGVLFVLAPLSESNACIN